MNLNVYSLAYPVTSLGPGERVVLWLAGCGKRCEGCISPEMRDPNAGKPVPVAALVNHLVHLRAGLDGITISGGEPFDQAEALTDFLELLGKARPNWSVIVYTGYTLSEIQAGASAKQTLLDFMDILIDGPYNSAIPATQSLAGSGNQTIHFLTPKGRALQPAMEAFPEGMVNWGLGAGAFDMMIGVVDTEARQSLLRGMTRPGEGESPA